MGGAYSKPIRHWPLRSHGSSRSGCRSRVRRLRPPNSYCSWRRRPAKGRSRRGPGRLLGDGAERMTLDEIAKAPELAAELPPQEAASLYRLAATAQAALLVRCVTAREPAPAPSTNQTLSVKAVAHRLGRKPAFVRALLRRGELPGRKVGSKSWGVLESELIAFQAGIDQIGSLTLPSGRDARRPAPHSQAAPFDPVAIRGPRRRPPGHGEEVGDRRPRDEGDN